MIVRRASSIPTTSSKSTVVIFLVASLQVVVLGIACGALVWFAWL